MYAYGGAYGGMYIFSAAVQSIMRQACVMHLLTQYSAVVANTVVHVSCNILMVSACTNSVNLLANRRHTVYIVAVFHTEGGGGGEGRWKDIPPPPPQGQISYPKNPQNSMHLIPPPKPNSV